MNYENNSHLTNGRLCIKHENCLTLQRKL